MAKILVVDDDSQLSGIIGKALKSTGHLAEIVGDGRSALELLDTYSYDLLVLDWNLPDMTGIDIARAFRRSNGVAPIIMLTARSAINDKSEGFEAGADDYLTKPFQLAEFLMRVKALLRRPTSYIAETITFGGVSLDSKGKRVWIDEEEISLPPKEFAILELLLTHQNEVFSQEAILDRLWSSDAEVVAASVYTAMKSLRKRLKEKDIIDTVYGAGYRLRKL